jgi:hypothetical protein
MAARAGRSQVGKRRCYTRRHPAPQLAGRILHSKESIPNAANGETDAGSDLKIPALRQMRRKIFLLYIQ